METLGAFNAAALTVCGQRQSATLATFPQLEQGVFEQRQHARPAFKVGQDIVYKAWLKGEQTDDAAIEGLIAARNAARKAKNFAEADRIRTELAMKGILLEDGPGGTSWRRAG